MSYYNVLFTVYLHTYIISLFYILQHDITHACYIHMYTIDAKYVYNSIKLYVLLQKQLIKSVKKIKYTVASGLLTLFNTSFYLCVGACVCD